MDLVDLKQEIDKFNKETLPLLDALLKVRLETLVADLHNLLDRLDGATITINIPRKD